VRGFLVVWTGQALSSLATGVVAFALSIEVYRQSGSISHFALAWLCTSLPGLLLAPLAGTLVDRCSRGAVLASAEALSALVIITLLARATMSTPPLAWLYLAAVGQSCNQALRWPALQALAGGMVPPERLARGAGLLQLSDAATQVLSPTLATLVVSMAGLPGTLGGALVAYVGALVALAVIRPGRAPTDRAARSLVGDWREAGRFVAAHGDLRRLLSLFVGINFLLGIVLVASPPWLLGLASPRAAGLALSAASTGMLIAGLRASCGERRNVADPLGRIRRQAYVAAACVALAGLLPSCSMPSASSTPQVRACGSAGCRPPCKDACSHCVASSHCPRSRLPTSWQALCARCSPGC
jgi:DHA3 family macrolide efflux protein-like MFS transporter